MDQAYLMQGDLIAAILVWSGIGWFLDRALGTRPVLLVLGALIGYAAGMYLIWLRSQRMDADDRAAAAADPVAGEGVGRVE
jgi:F0F1-type ATP synthase assembly protein I